MLSVLDQAARPGVLKVASISSLQADVMLIDRMERFGRTSTRAAHPGQIASDHKTVATFDHRMAATLSLTLHPLVAVENDLGAEGRISAHADRYMTPLWIDNMEIVVLDVRPSLAVTNLDDVSGLMTFDFPNRCWSVADDHQKQAAEVLLRQVSLGQFVFALADLRFNQRDLLCATKSTKPAGKGAGHLSQLRIVELEVIPAQQSPPTAQPSSRHTHGEVGIQNKAVYTVIAAFQQLGMVLGKLVEVVHAKTLSLATATRERLFAEVGPRFPGAVWENA